MLCYGAPPTSTNMQMCKKKSPCKCPETQFHKEIVCFVAGRLLLYNALHVESWVLTFCCVPGACAHHPQYQQNCELFRNVPGRSSILQRCTHSACWGKCWWLSPLWSSSDLGSWHIWGVWMTESLLRGSSRRSPRRRGSPWLWSVWCWWTAGCWRCCRSGRWLGCSGSWRSAGRAGGRLALECNVDRQLVLESEHPPYPPGEGFRRVTVGDRTPITLPPNWFCKFPHFSTQPGAPDRCSSPRASFWYSPFLALHERLSGWDR